MGDGRPDAWELGKPLAYCAKVGEVMVPLSCSTIWPETLSDETARFFAERIERMGNARIGAEDLCCSGHEDWWLPLSGCPWCGAVV